MFEIVCLKKVIKFLTNHFLEVYYKIVCRNSLESIFNGIFFAVCDEDSCNSTGPDYNPTIDPANFVTIVDNPLFH